MWWTIYTFCIITAHQLTAGKVVVSGEQSVSPEFHPFLRDESRQKRSVVAEDKYLPTLSQFALNDSHFNVLVDWTGEESQVIICVTKDAIQTENSTSNVYMSFDYGVSYMEKTRDFKTDNNKIAVIKDVVKNEKFINRYAFTDTVNKYIFVTIDYGRTIAGHKVDFIPSEVSFHPTNALLFIALDKDDKERKLWVTKDFGETWSPLSYYVKSFFWSTKTSPPTLYVEREEPPTDNSVISFQYFDEFQISHKTLITGVKYFEVKDDYLFAVKKPKLYGEKTQVDTLELWISYLGGPLFLAKFPNELVHQHYHIPYIVDGQIMVCVSHDDIVSHLYISSVPQSPQEQVKFSLSLKNILFFKPDSTLKETWLRKVTDKPFVDIYQVQGIKGVFIASQLSSNFTPATQNLSPGHITSLITFDLGGEWHTIQPPTHDVAGNPIVCDKKEKCSLHLGQQLTKLYPALRSEPMLSSKNAPGVILGTGTVGNSLKGHMNVYLSRDAGLSWHQVLQGSYYYAMGDHGGVIVAVQVYSASGESNELLYSTDEGLNWNRFVFYKEKLKVHGLLTEPGENATIFTLFGSKLEKHQWIFVTVNMTSVFRYACTKDDYKTWTPADEGTENHFCILGRKETFERRLPHSNCYNGRNYNRPILVSNCPCSRADYECDFGYESADNYACIQSPGVVDPQAVPVYCSPGQFFNRSKGYRKIPSDTCIGGMEFMFDPETVPCPLSEESEFLLVSARTAILRYNLLDSSGEFQTLPLGDVGKIVALDFDMSSNCLFWSDMDKARMFRQCFDGQHEREVLLETAVDSVEGIAFDWVTKNLYFTTGEAKTLEVIRTDIKHFGRMRKVLLDDKVLDKPRAIAVHPVRGYLFVTDWSFDKPMIGRTNLDGTNLMILFRAGQVKWPNGITVDYQAERIFFADAALDFIASADLDGQNVKKIIVDDIRVQQPFAVAVYKNLLFWDDWTMKHVFRADKEHGWGISSLSNATRKVLLDLKVFGRWSQRGTNACGNISSSDCPYLCLAQPVSGYSCLCPNGLKKAEGSAGRCLCPDGSAPTSEGACHKLLNGTCPENFFKCKNGNCILLSWLCDGDDDCGDKSDEDICGDSFTCAPPSWKCKNGNCVALSERCNFDDNCGDNSDEEGCTYESCTEDQFRCKNYRCIAKSYLCDFDDDCRDGSDEANCSVIIQQCRVGSQFECKDTKVCIPLSWQCDGDKDCVDGSDESGCESHTCSEWQFQCTSKKCIFQTWRCDGEPDCEDHSDELNCTQAPVTSKPVVPVPPFAANVSCSPLEMQCGNGFCIPFWWRCDGTQDCKDGSDERGCSEISPKPPAPPPPSTTHIPSKMCEKDQWQCQTGQCIWESWVCDGDKDCPSGEDEEKCIDILHCTPDQFKCWHSGGCINKDQRCNGKEDCADGSDEKGCFAPSTPGAISCPEGFFLCDKSTCIEKYRLCNHNQDCFDMTDEKDCHSPSKLVYQVVKLIPTYIGNTSVSFSWKVNIQEHIEGLEYKASIILKAAMGNPGAWRNSTWIHELNYTFTDLQPYTSYVIKVYIRNHSDEKEYVPLQSFTLSTAVGVPSPPRNVRVKQVGESIVVHWDPPLQPNGPLEEYSVYVTPPVPPGLLSVAESSHEVTFIPDKLEKLYIWVTASNSEFVSNNSITANFFPSALDRPIVNLGLVRNEVGNITLNWTAVPDVEGYIISYAYPENHFMGPKFSRKVSGTGVTFTNLSPGAQYVFEVQNYKGDIQGPPVSLAITTAGDQLPRVEGLSAQIEQQLGTTVLVRWKAPRYSRDYAWQYEVIWGRDVAELEGKKNSLITPNNSVTINHLEACEEYRVATMIAGPIGSGPDSILEVRTSEDPLAPPKNVETSVKGQHLIISWEPSCPQVKDTSLKYLVTIVETNFNESHYFEIPSLLSKGSTVMYKVKVHYGGRYQVIVQTHLNNSRPAPPSYVDGPEIPAPYELTFNPKDVTFFWRNGKNMPNEILAQNFSYVLYLQKVHETRSNDSQADEEVVVESFTPPAAVTSLEPGRIYYASVAFKDADGYLSPRSQVISVERSLGDSIILSQGSALGVIISVVVVILLLLGVVIVLAVRHRRLARSFLSFANSRYSSSHETTVISTDHNLDDDDSPMIHGFSDDEPLVIA